MLRFKKKNFKIRNCRDNSCRNVVKKWNNFIEHTKTMKWVSYGAFPQASVTRKAQRICAFLWLQQGGSRCTHGKRKIKWRTRSILAIYFFLSSCRPRDRSNYAAMWTTPARRGREREREKPKEESRVFFFFAPWGIFLRLISKHSRVPRKSIGLRGYDVDIYLYSKLKKNEKKKNWKKKQKIWGAWVKGGGEDTFAIRDRGYYRCSRVKCEFYREMESAPTSSSEHTHVHRREK